MTRKKLHSPIYHNFCKRSWRIIIGENWLKRSIPSNGIINWFWEWFGHARPVWSPASFKVLRDYSESQWKDRFGCWSSSWFLPFWIWTERGEKGDGNWTSIMGRFWWESSTINLLILTVWSMHGIYNPIGKTQFHIWMYRLSVLSKFPSSSKLLRNSDLLIL